ncbi:MAG TPA: DUF4431 domain-containing protein [Verrucomicrobiae bacterium]
MFSPKTIVTLIAMAVFSLTGCQSIPRDDIAGDKKVQVCGHIIRQTFPGPPNYESVAAGDEPLNYWILATDQPVTNMYPCGFSRPITLEEASKLQLVFMAQDRDEYKQYAPLVGQHVEVRGICFWAHSGFHCTPLLIEVKSIRLCEKQK